MNFGEDPLEDNLSDGSNDSFFDEPKPGPKSVIKTPEKRSANLFNDPPKKSDDWLGLGSQNPVLDVKKSPSRANKPTKKISFDDDDDILGNMGLSKRPSSRGETTTEENKGKKLDLLESILGTSKESVKKTTFDDIVKESKPKIGDVETKPREAPRQGRRGRSPSSGLMDPLGLFSSETPQEIDKTPKVDEKPKVEIAKKPVQSRSTPNIPMKVEGLPDWLGGNPITTSKSENALDSNPTEVETKREITPKSQNPPITETTNLNSLITQQKFANSHMEYQNMGIALQQQESQLSMALQLKKYEDNLSDMQLLQQEVLVKQEQQFNTLLERQFAKQQIIENNMRLQQERINNHIQLLLSQPPITKHAPEQQELEELKKNTNEDTIKVYDNMINTLKQRQHEEMFLLEESYKKQINLLEESLEKVEQRLRADAEKQTEMFQEKLEIVNKQHQEDISKHKEKIEETQAGHLDELKQIRENHTRIIDEIKFEQATLLENIKEAKQSETSLFSSSTTYAQKLDTNIEILYTNSKSLQEIRENMEKDYGILTKAREESLKAKEHEIIMMRATLEKCRESAENERAELLGLVRSLETKIAEQNQNAREERWTFQQAASTLASRSAALDRESEFSRASIEREREQLKTLRETILAEQDKMLLQITEERLSLSAEKSRLETSSKLVSNYDSQRAKAEIDAAVQIAKEATEMTDKERELLHREKCEVERIKRTLQDQERKLKMRETELEQVTKEAEKRSSDGEKAIYEARAIENKYKERQKDLQGQLAMLSMREKKLAEEKIALSKERLAIHTMMRQTRRCGLCAVDQEKFEDVNTSRYEADSDLIRIRLSGMQDDFGGPFDVDDMAK